MNKTTNRTDHLDRNAHLVISVFHAHSRNCNVYLHFNRIFNWVLIGEKLFIKTDDSVRLKHTVVFSSEPKKEPDWKDFSPGHLQFLDEQAEQERLGGQSEAIERLAGRREEEHSSVVLTAQERACECHVVQFLQELP